MREAQYYSTMAQVLPVLFILVVAEFRVFGGARGQWWASAKPVQLGQTASAVGSVVVVAFCFTFLMAEVGAFNAVKTGKASGFTEVMVDLALTIGLFLAVLVPSQPHFEALLDRTPLYRAKVWLWRRTGTLKPDDPDPPKAYEHDWLPPADGGKGSD